MKGLTTFLASAASLGLYSPTFAFPRDTSTEASGSDLLVQRALPNSPSGGYAPQAVDCPTDRPTIRAGDELSPNEKAWLQRRRNNTVEPMIEWLTRMNIAGFDAAAYINGVRDEPSQLPNIGIAASGGGYRALMNGAGFVAAADSRTENSTNTGQIGGLLQATTYLAGLSGGGWLVGSIYSNNYSSVTTLRDGSEDSSVWKFGNSILKGPDKKFQLLGSADYFRTIADNVDDKNEAGFNTSITDYWGRALSFQLIDDKDGGPAYTFSSIAEAENFKNGEIPMPFLVADGRAPGETIISLNSTVFEFNPWELGSWDPSTNGFAPLEYVGSNFSGGVVPQDGQCVRGFDQAGFVMGTSSSLFNQFLLQLDGTDVPSFLKDMFTKILSAIGQDNNDIAQWQPNPFFGWKNETNRNSQDKQLTLVDGGEDLQNIPLYPLIQPQRGVDVIFAIDSSADTAFNWPNGSAIIATYQRATNKSIENGTPFPSIPDVNTFINLGLNNRPTFFGCDPLNITSGSGLAPLVVYVPNAPHVTFSNVSTFDLAYNDTQRNLIIQNGYETATQANGTIDQEWSTCVACAVMSRSWHKTKTVVPEACNQCFQRYCWNGTVDSTSPSDYTPTLNSRGEGSGANILGSTALVVMIGVVVASTLLV